MLFLYWLLVTVMIVGVVGAIAPAVPGISLIVGAIVVWGLVDGFSRVGLALAIALAVWLLSVGIDFLAAYWGAKKAGASRWGQIGSVIGLTLGVLGLLPALPVGGPILGIIAGSLLGAFVGEFLYVKDVQLALRASVGILVGSLVGNLVQALLAIATVIVFLVTTWPTAMVN